MIAKSPIQVLLPIDHIQLRKKAPQFQWFNSAGKGPFNDPVVVAGVAAASIKKVAGVSNVS